MTNQRPLLEIVGVSKRMSAGAFKRRVTTVHGFDGAFRTGSVTALLGHNGAGKTTLIRMMLGIIRPDTGRILYEGRPMQRDDRRHVGYMPEVRQLPAELTSSEILSNQMALHTGRLVLNATDKAMVEHQLATTGLAKHAKKRISQLSKGLARRVAWAQAVQHQPRLLILDEPFSGLDPLARAEMQRWMTELRDAGTTMVVCTHELWTVQNFCTDFVMMNMGKVVARSSADTSLVSEGRYTLTLKDTTPDAATAAAKRHDLPAWDQARIDGADTTLVFGGRAAAHAWLAALAAGGAVEHFGRLPRVDESSLIQLYRT